MIHMGFERTSSSEQKSNGKEKSTIPDDYLSSAKASPYRSPIFFSFHFIFFLKQRTTSKLSPNGTKCLKYYGLSQFRIVQLGARLHKNHRFSHSHRSSSPRELRETPAALLLLLPPLRRFWISGIFVNYRIWGTEGRVKTDSDR